ncbi:phosphatidylinositol N-acetylglucosaminyltransferase subunit P-like [Panonychus citri]|uniref:phosphatidylinositol N-acetylglucosaminyltransferase subunit P-like n=1 Tax=Panonychus citri TaxID=50023 RepID=UPI002307089E|nr:phosphatidylinositol N-acetylglucosaminyltransferase subunit P-like [Panonychus citri]
MGEEALPLPSPGRCIYGYGLFILSNCLLIMYFISLIPDHLLDDFGLSYVPSKYWYIAIPTFLSTLIFVFGFIIYPSIVMLLTEPMESIHLFTDNFSNQKCNLIPDRGDISSIYDIPVEITTKMHYYRPEIA